MPERLVKIRGCYAGILDIASPLNAPGVFEHFMQRARTNAQAYNAGAETILYFNQEWVNAAQRGEILAWVLAFDGVYKASVDVVPSPPAQPARVSEFIGQASFPLKCPTGSLLVVSLDHLGQPGVEPIVTVEPGVYWVGLSVDYASEDRHALLSDVSDYPPADGPDWRIELARKPVDKF